MKKEYNTPEWELQLFSFESILSSEKVLDVSKNESGGHDHNDDDEGDW